MMYPMSQDQPGNDVKTPDGAPGLDPYRAWLDIRELHRPLNAYQLLDLSPLEADVTAIRVAAARQKAAMELRRAEAPPSVWKKVYREIETASDILLDPVRKVAYDRSLQSAEQAVPEAESVDVGQGAGVVCRHCRAPNPAVRKYCGNCGKPLWQPCIECGTLIGAGEKFCGACGANVAESLTEHVRNMEEVLQRAGGLISVYQFDEAITLLAVVTRRNDLQMKSLVQKAQQLLAQATTLRDQHRASAAAAFEQAQQLAGKHDYAHALRLIRQAPEQFLTEPMRHFATQMQERLAEIVALEQWLRQGLSDGSSRELLPKLGRLLAIQPDHAQAQQLSQKVIARVAAAAKNKVAAFQYEEALRLVQQVPEEIEIPGWSELCENVAELAWLAWDLRAAPVADKTLLAMAERLGRAAPTDARVAKMQTELERRVAQSVRNPGRVVPWAAMPKETPLGVPVEWWTHGRRIPPRDDLDMTTLHKHPGKFWVALGLALQGMDQATLATNLFPQGTLSVVSRMAKIVRPRSGRSAWGIDLSPSGLKAVKLAEDANGDLLLEDYEFIEHRKLLGQAGNQMEEVTLIEETTQAFLERHETKGSRMCAGLPGMSVFCRAFTMPPMPVAKLDAAIEFEVGHHIPFPSEELCWDYAILNEPDDDTEPDSHEILLVAVKQDQLDLYLNRYEQAGLALDVLQCDCLALHNAIIHEEPPPAGNADPRPPGSLPATAVLDVGSELSQLIVSSPGNVWFRNLGFAGQSITRALAQDLRITAGQAEQLKRDPAAAARMNQVYRAVEPVFQGLLAEVRQSMETFSRTFPTQRVARLVALGGTMEFHGLFRFLRTGR
jgi:type IV pilus assembly protein PilM